MKYFTAFHLILLLLTVSITAQDPKQDTVPLSYSNIEYDEEGRMYIEIAGEKIYENQAEPNISIDQTSGNPVGTDTGIYFDFGDIGFQGSIYYGFIPYGDSRHPHPVYFRSSAAILNGKAFIEISKSMSGRYDMVGWEKNKKGTIGYRVLNNGGVFLYDGILTFKGSGPFEIVPTVIEGPFVNLVTHEEATISFTTNMEIKPSVEVNGKIVRGKKGKLHEIKIDGLNPSTEYKYLIRYGDNFQEYSFRTAPLPGSRTSFTFAYASDSRSGNGGGERDIYGANSYIMKKIMALAKYRDAAFFQFTGDLVTGYQEHRQHIELEYANWKRSVQPFGAYFPIYVGMGNHEALNKVFSAENRWYISIDKFPFDNESSESVFADNFVMPVNGPDSEDGAIYDPSATTIDFPSYKENVFYYTYDNVAVVVLNSDYFYAPSTNMLRYSSGGLHGYIMDRQMEWLDNTIASLEEDPDIDHIFITIHTPFFPNGGHVQDDMWYNGNNGYRPYVAGKQLAKGIIERRDELLDIIVNKSSKVIAILTGDEHNYARTEISPQTERYPEAYFAGKTDLKRTIYQINNGAAGAPYYAQEETPWTQWVSGFTTQNALVLFHVSGNNIEMEVLNPDTLEEVDRMKLR
ncbi:MAG: metallophosphoesterase [Bacteroidales bacterium]|nr:metallophosphoesterase [Bacteroidales bacterium]